jgi:hypothetical protein
MKIIRKRVAPGKFEDALVESEIRLVMIAFPSTSFD